ncbi:MAG: Mth938-like domain-containing protein [Gammaproteobacteria bacterium]
MRITLDRHPSANLVTGVRPGEVRVGDQAITRSAILSADRIIRDWPVASRDDIDRDALEPALALEPEVLLVGTGARLEFPAGALVAELARRGVGLEFMDTAAACRTYNILINEDRQVVAALVIP